MHRLFVLLSSFILLSLFIQSNAQFTFQTTGYFRNVQGNNYYDLCSSSQNFVCPAGTEKTTSYCDADCRQYYKCKSFICRGDTSYVGPFCFNNVRCPDVFNSAYTTETQLRWGQPASSEGMSGMGFNGKNSRLPLQSEFQLGELVHYNWPIYANTNPSTFEFVFQLTIRSASGAVVIDKREFAFPMRINETPNDKLQPGCGGNCEVPSRFPLNCRQGLPLCPDQISITQQVTNQIFSLNGVDYTLILSGFRFPGESKSTDKFNSDEGQYTVSQMFGVVTPACKCPDPKQIPKFNPTTFACDCSCPACPNPNWILKTETCACECPCCDKTVKSILNDAKQCVRCDCSSATCAAPRVPQGDQCCCKCPTDLCKNGGVPDEKSADCGCKCPPGVCNSKGPNFVTDKNCNCVCGITAATCSPSQVFNAQNCSCDCKCPPPKGQFKAVGNCGYTCDSAALKATCDSQKRTTLFTPFDPVTCNDAKCQCGPCLPCYTEQNGVCVFVDKPCPGLNTQAVLNKDTCTCDCPPQGPTCKNLEIPGPNCTCVPCDITKGNCNCPPTVQADCVKKNRAFVFNQTLCGCTDCLNNFVSPQNAPNTSCSVCPLDNTKCRPNPRDLFVVDTANCKCVCPAQPKCPQPFDILEINNCTCRDCKPGECICGNGIVEAGEDCDPGNSTQECCQNCKFVVDVPCSKNKCGICKRTNPDPKVAPTCVDNSLALCNATDECVERSCAVDGLTYKCIANNLDGRPCGDKNLCLRRCNLGKCEAYDQDTVDNRCVKDENVTKTCGECCEYTCDPAVGKCKANWNESLPCSDGKFCTDGDKCVKSTNSSGPPLVCQGTEPKCTSAKLNNTQPPGFPCMIWDCSEPSFRCVSVPVTGSNVTCPGSGYCNLEGVCSPTGECIRPRRQCDKPAVCVEVRCRESLGKCEESPALADGIPCDDGDNCTSNDRCSNGKCAGDQSNCTVIPPTGGTPLTVPLAVTAAVVATGAAVAGFFVYQAMQKANIMDPVSWGEMNANQFDNNPLYQENTKFGENPLFRS